MIRSSPPRVDQMLHFRFPASIAVYLVLQFAIGQRLPRVLAQVLRPRMHQKCFDITISGFRVVKDSPARCAISAAYAFVFAHGV
jgi:hypothetical protein